MNPTNTDTREDLERLLVGVASEAGALLRRHALHSQEFEWKKKDDPVTKLDKKVERLIKDRIGEQMEANFLGEEYGLEDNGSRYTFIIDPIDGTKAYMRQDFLCAISVGLEEDGDLIGGVVYDFMRDIMFVGYRGNLYRLHDGTEYPFSTEYSSSKTRIMMEKMEIEAGHPFADTPDTSVTTRLGSIAMAMAQLASGAFDCMVLPAKTRSNAWDIAAATYLLQEAGYRITERSGAPFDHRDPRRGAVIAKPEIYDSIREVLDR